MKSAKFNKLVSMILALALILTCDISAFAASAYLSENEAQAIVLAHAQIEAQNAVFTKTKFDKKTNTYEIKFTCGDDKYEYEISAADGSVLDYEWDIEDGGHHASQPEPDQRPDYQSNIQAAEESALAALGVTRENTKYINSYVKYGEYHTAYAIHVEVGIYDRAVSPQTVVHSFDFNMDGEIIEQTAPEQPEPTEPSEPVEPTVPVTPDEPDESTVPDESDEANDYNTPDESDETDDYGTPDESDETDEPEASRPAQTGKPEKKKASVKSIKVNSTNVKLKKGQKFAIKVTKNPVFATDKITYSTSKKKVATVSKKGVITAKAKGSCKITVKCNGKKKIIKVTVKK